MGPYSFKKLLQKVTTRKIVRGLKRLVIAFGCAFLLFLLLNALFPLPDKIEYATIVRDANGEIIHAYLTSDDKWRMRTELDEISPLLRRTIVAKEDRFFYQHPGVNLLAAGRAAFMNITQMRRTSGASTITMQVARALRPAKRNILNKLVETFMALQLEWKYDKEEILQLYLNLVPYGGNIEGVKAASLLYFNKDPDHLSLAEITALSIIPNRPSSLVLGKANDLIVQERNKWLRRFAANGVFTKKEIDDALAEPLQAHRSSLPSLVPHLSRQLRRQQPGENIRSYINTQQQARIEKLTQDYVRALKLQKIRNAAVIVIDNRTNRVVSYIGSADFKDTTDGGQVNGAAAVRQPGSTLKPLLYGLCFDNGLLTPKTVVTDVPVNYSGYAPENYNREFNGFVTIEHALEQSLNIPSVKSLQQLGKDEMIETLILAGFQQVRKDKGKLGLSMILGGCGATLEELTGLFSAFANNGVYAKPLYTQRDDRSRKVRLLSPEASYMITDILSRVNRPDFPINWTATEHMPKIAWKTGTSYGRRDAWSIGYNKNYTVGVWVGNFSGAGVTELSGANTATPLLFKIFNTIDYDSNSDWFAPGAAADIRQVCSASGLVPGSGCTNLVTDQFIPLVSSTQTCQHLQEFKISADGQQVYCASCVPASGYKKRWYHVLPAEMQQYYEERGKPFEKLPPHNPRCEKIFRGEGPVITAPQQGNEYLISKSNPEPLQLSVQAAPDVSKLYWYINDKFYKVSNKGEKQFFIPQEGTVKISCTDDKGRNRNIKIQVRYIEF